QLALSAGYGNFEPAFDRVLEHHRAVLRPVLDRRHLQHLQPPVALADRQERAPGAPALVAQRGQDNVKNVAVMLEYFAECRVEPSAPVPVGRALEFVVEAEGIEE